MTEPGSAPSGPFEVELRQPLPGAEEWAWRPVTVFVADAIPTELRFDTLGEARAYDGRLPPGAARIVAADEEGTREVVDGRSAEAIAS